MKRERKLVLGIIIVASLLLTICCDMGGSNDAGYTAVTLLSVEESGGTSGTVDSTVLTLTFDEDPTTLTADNITVIGATKGELSGSGTTTRSLVISDIVVNDGETVYVVITSPSGFTISDYIKTAVIYRKIYALGDTGPAGGLIFYDKGAYSYGWRYLEAAPVSTEWTSKVWGGYAINVSGAYGLVIGTGSQNTIDIVTQFGDEEPFGYKTDYAAKLCNDLVCGDYDDWFLPSKDELGAIWDNLVKNDSGGNSGVGGFAGDDYWSSSEFSSDGAWFQSFNNGARGNDGKYFGGRVRAVRAF